ncbi:MAG: ABC transporter ATP-binding protein [Candidatus Moranbacteria bacterium]|nr:ABC transporter ATP-binding protein [Candidatus Moranbacteria bacterium]
MSPDTKKSASRLPAKKILSWYWRVARRYRFKMLGALSAYGIGSVISNAGMPIVLKRIIDIVTGGVNGPIDAMWKLFLLLAASQLSVYLLFRLGDFFYFLSQSRALRDLSRFTFDQLHRHSYEFFSNRFSGSLVSQARRFVDAFETIEDVAVWTFWLSGIRLASMLAVLWYYLPSLGFLFLFSIILVVAVGSPFLRVQQKRNAEEAAENTKVTGRFADVVSNILNVKLFSASESEKEAYREYTEREEHARRKAVVSFIRFSAVQNGSAISLQIGVFAYSLYAWSKGEISPGMVVIVQTYVTGIWSLVWDLSNSISRMLKAFANASEMVEIFELPQDLTDPEHPETCRISRGSIEFRDVSFRYAGGNVVFSRFSFAVRAGEKVGLVGPSGGGKSTITKLLLRFADPQEGAVHIDGQDIRNIRQDDLRNAIAYVPQDPLLFHRSLRENIAYGDPSATEAEILSASKRAHAHEFISKLHEGYGTLVGERGVKLSGGQRQRIAIARAILKNAPILILDEATSALDSESEHAIQEALAELMKGKTAIVIAHRLSTIRRMDRIVVLGENGTVEEEGTHEDLLARNGHYAALWARQTGGFIDADPDETDPQDHPIRDVLDV